MKYVKWALAWILYGLGDLASKMLFINQHCGWWVGLWYPIYNRLMSWSVQIQGEGNCGPWKAISPEEE